MGRDSRAEAAASGMHESEILPEVCHPYAKHRWRTLV